MRETAASTIKIEQLRPIDSSRLVILGFPTLVSDRYRHAHGASVNMFLGNAGLFVLTLSMSAFLPFVYPFLSPRPYNALKRGLPSTNLFRFFAGLYPSLAMDFTILAIVGVAIAGSLFILVGGCLIVYCVLRRRERSDLTRISNPLGGFANPNETYAPWQLPKAIQRSKPHGAKSLSKAAWLERRKPDLRNRTSIACGSPDSTTSSTRMMMTGGRNATFTNVSLPGNTSPTGPTTKERGTGNATNLPSNVASPLRSAQTPEMTRTGVSSTPLNARRKVNPTNAPWSAPVCRQSHPYESPVTFATPTRFSAEPRIVKTGSIQQRSECKPRSFSYPLKPWRKEQGSARNLLRPEQHVDGHYSLPSPVHRDAKRRPRIFNGHEDWSCARIQRGVESKASVRPPLTTQDSSRVSTDNTVLESNASALSMSLVTANPTPVKGAESSLPGGRARFGEIPTKERHLDRIAMPPPGSLPASITGTPQSLNVQAKLETPERGQRECNSGSKRSRPGNQRSTRTQQPQPNHETHSPRQQHHAQAPRQTQSGSQWGSDGDGEDQHAAGKPHGNELREPSQYQMSEDLAGDPKSSHHRLSGNVAALRKQADSPSHTVLQFEHHDSENEYRPKLNDELEGSYPPTPTKPAGPRKPRTGRRPAFLTPTYIATASSSSLTQRLSISSWSSSRQSANSPTITCSSDSSIDPFIISQFVYPPTTKPNGPRPCPTRGDNPRSFAPNSKTCDPASPPSPRNRPLIDAVNRLREMNSDSDSDSTRERPFKLISSLPLGERI